MEVPLDKQVANRLRAVNRQLPIWDGIINLTLPISDQYESQASLIAAQEDIARVNLDLKYWRSV